MTFTSPILDWRLLNSSIWTMFYGIKLSAFKDKKFDTSYLQFILIYMENNFIYILIGKKSLGLDIWPEKTDLIKNTKNIIRSV